MFNQVRILRKQKGWSQQQLGELLEVSRQTVNAIETNKYDPSLTLSFKISGIFELSIEEIFDPQRDPREML